MKSLILAIYYITDVDRDGWNITCRWCQDSYIFSRDNIFPQCCALRENIIPWENITLLAVHRNVIHDRPSQYLNTIWRELSYMALRGQAFTWRCDCGISHDVYPDNSPPGQLPTRTTPQQDNSPPGQLPTRKTPTRTTPHQDNSHQDNSPPGQLPTRTIPHQDNSHQDNSPPGQLPTRTTPHQDNSPPGQLPPGQLPTRTTPHQDNSPLGQFPTRTTPHQDNSPPGQLPTRTIPH